MNQKILETCDVLLLTVTKVEMQAVLAAAYDITQEKHKTLAGAHKTYFDLGIIGGARTFAVRSEMGSDTVGGALLTTRNAIDEVKPQSIVMVGIAFGVDETKQKIGDILVSQQLQNYGPQRIGTGESNTETIVLRGDKVTATERLIDRLRTYDLKWTGSVKFGLVLSGPHLIDNIDYRNQLKTLAGEPLGGEMEGAGLYAACIQAGIGWIVVKAICDWADGNKSEDKDAKQHLAATNAARFVISAIKEGGFRP